MASASEAPPDAAVQACSISGAGELAIRGEARRTTPPRFAVFSERAAQHEVGVVVRPQAVQVAWSRLPVLGEAAQDDDIGGKRGVAARTQLSAEGLHISGWAPLRGRLFQLRERAEIAPDTLWARRGAPVEILGVRGPLLAVKVQTPARSIDAPKELTLETACGNLAYEPSRAAADPGDAAPSGVAIAEPVAGVFDLHRAPDGPRVVRLDLAHDPFSSFAWMEQRGRWVRVAGGDADIAFDAWVPAWQVRRFDGGRGIGLGGFGTSSCCGWAKPRWGKLRTESMVRVGARADGAPIGSIEAGAKVLLDQAMSGGFQSFRLPRGHIAAPEGARFWVAADDVEPISDAET